MFLEVLTGGPQQVPWTERVGKKISIYCELLAIAWVSR